MFMNSLAQLSELIAILTGLKSVKKYFCFTKSGLKMNFKD